jgi:hypothetical protein
LEAVIQIIDFPPNSDGTFELPDQWGCLFLNLDKLNYKTQVFVD